MNFIACIYKHNCQHTTNMISSLSYYAKKNTARQMQIFLKEVNNTKSFNNFKCKNNRAIIFDGSIPHHSTTPTDVNYACSLNIDYRV